MNELQLVYRERTYVADLADIGLSTNASDNRIREVVELHFELGKGALRNHQVTRPGGVRILISERAVLG
jgi:hypothetical protein